MYRNKEFLIFFIVIFLCCCFGENLSENKPNIILILADDMVNY